jgi:hypothetical protein
VILPGTTADGAVQLAEELRKSIAAERIEIGEGRAISITISVGVCGGVPAAGQRVEDLIGAADQALYQAKENGRDRVERWRPEAIQAGTPYRPEGTLDRGQRLLEIGLDVVDVLDADRQPHHVFRHAGLLRVPPGELAVRGGGRVAGQRSWRRRCSPAA